MRHPRLTRFHLPEQEHQGDHQQGRPGQEVEDVEIRHHRRLLLHRVIDHADRLPARASGRCPAVGQGAGDLLQGALILRVLGRDMADQSGLMELRPSAQPGLG